MADGILFFAGWSPGGEDDPENAMPDVRLAAQGPGQEQATRPYLAKKPRRHSKDFFDNQDQNKDGSITRDEWDTILKFMNEGKNSAFALKPGGTGDVTESHVLWKQTKGLPYVPSAIVYRGQ